jgi:hypothetical protein
MEITLRYIAINVGTAIVHMVPRCSAAVPAGWLA